MIEAIKLTYGYSVSVGDEVLFSSCNGCLCIGKIQSIGSLGLDEYLVKLEWFKPINDLKINNIVRYEKSGDSIAMSVKSGNIFGRKRDLIALLE
jgi:hypothetical protein